MVEAIHALTARIGTWEDATELVNKLNPHAARMGELLQCGQPSPKRTGVVCPKPLAARELLKTAQDDVEGQWRVYSNSAAMACRAATPDITPRDSDEGSDKTNLGGDEE